MASVKTAVSLDERLFREVEEIAREMKVPRSRVVALALRDYIRRRENRKLVAEINAAYGDGPTPEDDAEEEGRTRLYREVIGEW